MNRIQLSIMNVIESLTIGNGKNKLIRMKPLGALMLLLAAACSNALAQTTVNFSYTGSVQTWTVPAGVTSITIDAAGAVGGGSLNSSFGGGLGGRVQATYAVTSGTVLNIFVGGSGGNGAYPASGAAAGGYNGGGNSSYQTNVYNACGGGGGGATDIRIGGTALTNRVLVAGGGGGGAQYYNSYNGGNGGGTTGGIAGAYPTTTHATGVTQSSGGNVGI